MENDWFRSYLSNRQQFVSIGGVESEMKIMKYGVPHGSVLGPLLFLIYINDLHSTILQFWITHHFADDTNLLIYLNLDLKNLTNWLKANKISLNTSKTELIIFHPPKK